MKTGLTRRDFLISTGTVGLATLFMAQDTGSGKKKGGKTKNELSLCV